MSQTRLRAFACGRISAEAGRAAYDAVVQCRRRRAKSQDRRGRDCADQQGSVRRRRPAVERPHGSARPSHWRSPGRDDVLRGVASRRPGDGAHSPLRGARRADASRGGIDHHSCRERIASIRFCRPATGARRAESARRRARPDGPGRRRSAGARGSGVPSREESRSAVRFPQTRSSSGRCAASSMRSSRVITIRD